MAASTVVLIGTEIGLVAVALVWAVGGLLGLGLWGDLVMAAPIAPLFLWTMWMVARLAYEAELELGDEEAKLRRSVDRGQQVV